MGRNRRRSKRGTRGRGRKVRKAQQHSEALQRDADRRAEADAAELALLRRVPRPLSDEIDGYRALLDLLEIELDELDNIERRALGQRDPNIGGALKTRARKLEIHNEIQRTRQHLARARRRRDYAAALSQAEQPPTGGRPSKLTPMVAHRIYELVETGMSPNRAALAAGVSKTTIERWRTVGREDPGSRYGAFLVGLEAAQAEGQRKAAQVISDHLDPGTDTDPKIRQRAAEFMLRYGTPEDYRTHQRTETTGAGGGPVVVQPALPGPQPGAQPLLDLDQLADLEDDQLERADARLGELVSADD